MLNKKIVLRDLSHSLKYLSGLFLVPALVGLYFHESPIPFILPFLITFFISKLIHIDEEGEARLREGIVTVTILWLGIILVSALPFILLAKLSFLNALFESASAWTTTGLTDTIPENLPKSLLFWRSFEQWLGGIGVITLAILGLFKAGGALFIAEGHEKIKPNIFNTVKMLCIFYGMFTIFGVILFLLFSNLSLFDAVNHTMTALSTGGLSTKTESIGFYSNLGAEVVSMVMMLIGSISFLMHYRLVFGGLNGIGAFLKDIQNLMLFLIVFMGAAFLFLERSLRVAVFHAVSALSGTGFNLVDLTKWEDYSKLILITLMIFGGAMGSTAGGLKLIRVAVFFKTIYLSIMRTLYPNRVFLNKFGDHTFKNEEILGIFKFIALYVLLLYISAFLLTLNGDKFIDALFMTASAQGNVGLSVTGFDSFTKIILIWNMIIGRLELWGVLMITGLFFWGRSK